MALDFAMSGGNFVYSNGTTLAPGTWATVSSGFGSTSSAPSYIGQQDSYAWSTISGGSAIEAKTSVLPGVVGLVGMAGLIAGYRLYFTTFVAGVLIQFYDASGNIQCALEMTNTGLLYFTRNGTTIGSSSSFTLTQNAWAYIEFKAIFSTGGGGTCEVRVNGGVIQSSTGLTNATTANGGGLVAFEYQSNAAYFKDCYIVDTVNGANTNYLGDIKVYEVYDIGPGINSKWLPAVNVGPFVLTSVSNGGGPLAIYTGTITGGGANAYVNYYFNTNGFFNSDNNQIAVPCASSNATALVLTVSAPITAETNSATAVATPPFALTNVSTSNVFTGFIPYGASNAYVGYNFNVSGFTNAANNVVNATCTASTATSLTLSSTGLVAENHSTPVANATFQSILQIGINYSGTRPGNDIAYIYDSNPGDISDFIHQQPITVGTILGVVHLSNVRKDDAGTRIIQQFVNSGGTIALSSNVSPGTSYQYYSQILETDPATNVQFSITGFNNMTTGVKLIQ